MSIFLSELIKGAVESLPPSDPRAGLKPTFDPTGETRRPDRRAAEASRQPEPRPLTNRDIAAYDSFQEREALRETARAIREQQRRVEQIEALRDRDYDTYMERFSDKLAAMDRG